MCYCTDILLNSTAESLDFDMEMTDHQQCASGTRSSCCMPSLPSNKHRSMKLNIP